MTFSELYLPEYQNKSTSYLGTDSRQKCFDKKHFERYSKTITYAYNSRGFRDQEWVSDDEISSCIWCVGDSFTAGIGQPFDEIWPRLLMGKYGIRTINVSMDGASNEWISRKVKYIIDNISPNHIVIQWSYISRRELSDITLTDCERRLSHDMDIMKKSANNENFIKCLLHVESNKQNTTIIHTFIPGWSLVLQKFGLSIIEDELFWKTISDYYNFVNFKVSPYCTMLDYARDNHHYDVMTSMRYTKNISKLIAT